MKPIHLINISYPHIASSLELALENLSNIAEIGTLAIDLGNSTTVVAFQNEHENEPKLLDLPPISRIKGEIPSLIWCENSEQKKYLIGQQVIEQGLASSPNLISDFKRWIGVKPTDQFKNSKLLPEEAGEILVKEVWQRLPKTLNIKRLVITAPVESYRAYRKWLHKVCSQLPVAEIALVDEPTAAAMGSGIEAGSKLLVVDIGGSTIDLSLVKLEGGEGKAEPVAQLMRFQGQDLEGKSNQKLRCAKVLGKAGLRLGGRDIDRWIIDYLLPGIKPTEELLNSAERLKWKLSEKNLDENIIVEEDSSRNSEKTEKLRLSKFKFQEILIERGFISSIESLLEKTLAAGRSNDCDLKDLKGVVAVGGGSQIPLFKQWLEKKIKPTFLITPPPIEAVAIGALSLTPEVKVRDVLRVGVSLRCWDKRSGKHIWHPLFMAGQPWPTSKPLRIILSASKDNQTKIELFIGEPETNSSQEIIYINGIPTIKENLTEPKILPWDEKPIEISLDPPGKQGEDCIELEFNINNESGLVVKGLDLRKGSEISLKTLGFIR